MARVVAGTRQVEFSPAEDGGRLVLELDSRQGLAPGTTYRVRLYPSVPATIAASVGTATMTLEQRNRTVARELVTFDGSDRAAPAYPVSQLTGIAITGALFTLTADGFEPAGIGAADFHLDPNGEIVAPVRLWGAIVISYVAAYRILLYSPDVTGYNPVLGGSFTVAFGTVYAFYEGASGTLEIESARREAGRNRFGLYVAYSLYVADEGITGWELPPDWPTSGDYPQVFPEGTPDPDASATRERPHRVGAFNNFGQIFEDEIQVSILKPYTGSFTYHPKVWARFAGAPPAGDEWEDAYKKAIAFKSEILDELAVRYPNFQGEGGPS